MRQSESTANAFLSATAAARAPIVGRGFHVAAPKRVPSKQTARVLDYLGAVRAAAAFIRGGL